jgi:HlyD family secretion protein
VEKAPLSDLTVLARERQSPEDTCRVPQPSFHWKTRVLLPVLILSGFLSLLLVASFDTLAPAVEVKFTPVIVKSQQGRVAGAVTVQAAGWVEADPYKSYVTALADGVVREVLVLEGQAVEKDQVVARLVDDDARLSLQRAEADVHTLEAGLASARADREAAKTEWENPVDRRRSIDVADAELKEARASLEQTAADIVREEAVLEQEKSDYDRAVPLHKAASISEAELVRMRSKFNAQKAKVESTRFQHSLIRARIAKHEADLTAALENMKLRIEERRKLDQSQAAVMKAEAELARAKAALDEAHLRLERMDIKAPVAGVVMRRLTEPGSKLVFNVDNQLSANVLSLYNPKSLQVRVDVPLADVMKIGVGQDAEVVVDVLPDRVFSGTVTRVLHEANIQKNTLEVKVAVTDPAPELRPEMLARVRFLARSDSSQEQSRQSVFAPAGAFRSTGGTVTAWLLVNQDGDRGIARSRTVRLGRTQTDGWVEVLEGLQPGDLLITQSASELKDHKRVKILGES